MRPENAQRRRVPIPKGRMFQAGSSFQADRVALRSDSGCPQDLGLEKQARKRKTRHPGVRDPISNVLRL